MPVVYLEIANRTRPGFPGLYVPARLFVLIVLNRKVEIFRRHGKAETCPWRDYLLYNYFNI